MIILKCPEIRFKNDDGNNYPNWEDKKLDNVFKFYKGKGISKIELSEEGIPCIIYGELYTKYREVIGVVKSKTNIKKELLFMSEIGDILIPSSGETQKDIATASTVMEKNVALGGDINILRSKETINSPYVSYYLKHIKNIEISKLSQGNSVVHLYSKQLSNLKIEIPSLEEQQKIGDFFMLLDKRIEQQEQKIALLKDYKKAMMQKIFSQKIRFKDENGNDYPDWEEKKFLNIFFSIPSRAYQIFKTEIFSNGKIPVVDQGKKKVAGYSNEIEKICDKTPCIVFGDHTTELKYIDFPFIIGADGTKILRNHIANSTLFLYYLLLENNVEQEGYKRHFSILTKKSFDIPMIKEQEKIASFLSSIDFNIENQEGILENLKTQKGVLLHKMFI